MARAFFVRREQRNPVPRAPHLQPTPSDPGRRSGGTAGGEPMGGRPLSPTGTSEAMPHLDNERGRAQQAGGVVPSGSPLTRSFGTVRPQIIRARSAASALSKRPDP